MSNLVYVSLPSSLIEMHYNIFDDCFELQTVIINQPSQLRHIDQAIFSTCRKLTSFVIPASVEYMGRHIFAEITSHLKVYYCGNRIFTEDLFLNTSSVEIIVPLNGVPMMGNRPTKVGITPCDIRFKGSCKQTTNSHIFLTQVAIFLCAS